MSSTVTALETYDTHMTDYPIDSDIAMYSGTITAESWLSPEDGTMEDDSAHSPSEPIEIEMADDEEYADEYEMADSEVFYYPEDTELVDVEVVDEHSVASPSIIPVAIAHSEHTTDFLEPPSMLPSALPSPSMRQSELLVPTIEHDWSLNNPTHSESSAEPAPTAVEPSPAVFSDMGEVVSVSAPAIPATVVADTVEVAPTHSFEVQSSVQESSIDERSYEDRADAEELPVLNVDVEEQATSNAEPDPAVLEDANADPLPPHDETGPSIVDTADHPVEHVSGQDHTESEEQQSYEVHATFEETQATEGADPHEISAGIFIDPPPAVLLEVSYSSEQLEYSLFNQPISGSGSQTPTADVPPQLSQTYSLLLHERPTLYYEPLSDVFTALRQEEAVSSVPELAEGELVLDAYDLRLVASEDNMYMHEVTLHELNILHDGADLSGPLRLRLYARSPRFITRYHALRDQISRLEIGEEDSAHDTYDEQATTYEEQPLPEERAEDAEEPLPLLSDNIANSDVHTVPSEEHESQENQQQQQVAEEYQEGQDEHEADPQEEGYHVEGLRYPSPGVDRHDQEAPAVAGDVDDAYADDTTEGTEEGEIPSVPHADQDAYSEAPPAEIPTSTYDHTPQPPDDGEDASARHEVFADSDEHEALPKNDDASHETYEYDADDTTNTADPNIDQGPELTTDNSQETETQEDELDPEYDEEEEGSINLKYTEDEYEDYDEEFDELATHDEQHISESKPPSLSVQTGETLAETSEGGNPSLTSAQYDTPASRTSKRSFDLVEPDFEDYEDDLPPSPPDSKRQKTG
ncbi:hypothetical protein QCA50_002851 [Cerrena zonata]|uniref:Uncharacterized protein n=1 Tax=Cerrena zonata TaxID=2478898 RepID=A0AAW0GN56_9APHY